MAILYPRRPSSQYASDAKRGWALCMSKAYCKWPAIAGIVISILFICLTLFCCLKCCGCLGGRRRRGSKNKNQQSFMPAPYQGYQPANSNIAPPAYGQQPAQYAHFDRAGNTGYGGGNGNGKMTEDSLPPMPSWQEARETRMEDPAQHRAGGMELGALQKPAMASTSTQLLPPSSQQTGIIDAGSAPLQHRAPSPYTGPDFGAAGALRQPSLPQYSGPDFSAPGQTAFSASAYTPSQSTRYEPSYANEPQELATAYSNVPMSPSQDRRPNALHAGLGKKPDPHAGQQWRDV